MTEAEWNESGDPRLMLELLQGKATERKLRLFAVACCRRIWHLLADQRLQRAVKIAERYADGQVDREELEMSHQIAVGVADTIKGVKPTKSPQIARNAARYAARAVRDTAGQKLGADSLGHIAFQAAEAWKFGILNSDLAKNISNPGRGMAERALEPTRQGILLRDIFGPLPFRLIPIDKAWLTATVKQLAEAVYWDRALDRMPILGDALEEAGCANLDILNHCRQPGEHFRGCWIIDLLTGRK